MAAENRFLIVFLAAAPVTDTTDLFLLSVSSEVWISRGSCLLEFVTLLFLKEKIDPIEEAEVDAGSMCLGFGKKYRLLGSEVSEFIELTGDVESVSQQGGSLAEAPGGIEELARAADRDLSPMLPLSIFC